MPSIVMTNIKEPHYDKIQKAKILTFLTKLRENDTTKGLNIERMVSAVDSRARTGRVDLSLRAVLYKIDTDDPEPVYVYAGTWPHDEAIERARTRALRVNPINGVTELIEIDGEVAAPAPVWQPPAPAPAPGPLDGRGISVDDIVGLGFDRDDAQRIISARSEDELLAIAEAFENSWQSVAAIALGIGDSIDTVRRELGLDDGDGAADSDFLAALGRPASQMQFTMIDSDDELRRVIEDGSFGDWRTYLHPSQRSLVERCIAGSFLLTGGAGTGKSIVLVHRARALQRRDPVARVVLTTFTRSLATNLERDLDLLDPQVPRATALGGTGVLVRGVDALASAVREVAGAGFDETLPLVLGGAPRRSSTTVATRDDWSVAALVALPHLPAAVAGGARLEQEYLENVLPNRILAAEQYLALDAPHGLDTAQRMWIWAAIERYRENARVSGRLSFAEVAEVAAAWLDLRGERLADHVLVDEGQDLSPSHWRLVRALVARGPNDLFIAEDAHQRIYASSTGVGAGIDIAERERLTLNYRTTEQTLEWALRILSDETFTDGVGRPESSTGARSARRGPSPSVIPAATGRDQLAQVVATVSGWLDGGVERGSIAVLVRSNNAARDAQDALVTAGIRTDLLVDSAAVPVNPSVLTMHTAKGMQFARVVLYDVSDAVMPAAWAVREASPEAREDALRRERSLLYVAATRARDELVVTHAATPSPLLPS